MYILCIYFVVWMCVHLILLCNFFFSWRRDRLSQKFMWFWVHLSGRLKWAFVISRCPSSHVNFHIFDFSSETTEQILTTLDRKQELNVLYQVSVFCADPSSKMAALASDWLKHFSTSSPQLLNGFWWNLTGSKSSTPSIKFVIFVPIANPRWPPWPLIC